MTYTEHSISFHNNLLYYYKAGNGPEPLLLFHGFAQDHTFFESIIKSVSNDYTLYLFDLFFHGKSAWPNIETPLKKENWKQILELFLQENSIEMFSVGGFSLGGKLVLCTLESFADRINRLFLLAPDGIKISPWYKLATSSLPMRKFFRSMISHPQIFNLMVTLATHVRPGDKSIVRFAESQMNTKEKRSRVYNTWVVFRKLKFNMKVIGSLMDTLPHPPLIIVGKFDKVIKASFMTSLSNHSKKVKIIPLETGHNGILKHPDLPEWMTL